MLLRGMSRQMSQPNFIHELLDIRYVYACRKMGLNYDAPAPPALFAEIRQDTNYQVAGGTVSMSSGSRIYSYLRDRCLIGQEHMIFNGWGASDTNFDGVTEDVWHSILPESTPDAPVVKKGKRKGTGARSGVGRDGGQRTVPS